MFTNISVAIRNLFVKMPALRGLEVPNRWGEHCDANPYHSAMVIRPRRCGSIYPNLAATDTPFERWFDRAMRDADAPDW